MAKKQTRNKFRDLLGDYYLTNRGITKHYDAEYEKKRQDKEKTPWKSSEKIMIGITLIALALIAVKYLLLN